RSLLGLVLLFCVFVIYQQHMIKQLRSSIAGQMGMITALETRAEIFQKMAIQDQLTGLFNRRFATEHLPAEIARAERGDLPFTVLMIDLNGFKKINDAHGHAAGDLALRVFAQELKKCIRSSDLPVRMGGDEFLVLLPECRAYGVPPVLARLRGAAFQANGVNIPLTFAAGWAEYVPGESPERLLLRADQALYDDKCTGRADKQVQELEADARQAEKMQIVGHLTGRVVHDFNNLLTVIKGYSEIVLAELDAEHPMGRRLKDISKAATQAALLTQQLLAFSRKQAVESKVVDLNAKVEDMESLIRPLLGDKIKLVSRLAPDLGNVHTRAGQIEQIIMNLIVNARDAMAAGGTLTIETDNTQLDSEFVRTHPGSRQGSYVRLAISDTGMGMDEETKAHLFEPFFTTKPSGVGTGLGLSTVYGAVKQLGGYIEVQSGSGKGSRFAIYLPYLAAEPAATPGANPEAAQTDHARPGHHTVLVVENVESLRKLTCEFLQTEGYNFLEAETAAQALRIAVEHTGPIQVALTDVMLPGMSSRELAEALMATRPEIKMLYIVGYVDAAVACDDVIRTGAFLETPFSPIDLSRKIRGLVAASAQ
ncbi:MAG TPA: diguanylate cyclase, partial [Terriglobales bacterium]